MSSPSKEGDSGSERAPDSPAMRAPSARPEGGPADCFECGEPLSTICMKCNPEIAEDKSPDGTVMWTIRAQDVEWVMPWSTYKDEGGAPKYPGKEDELIFEHGKALAHLLLNGVIFAGAMEVGGTTALLALCNDVFAWGCSDSEELPHAEIEPLYRMWRKDPRDGISMWACIQRREMPQRPVERDIRKQGVWDIDALKAEHGLRSNHYDGVSGVLAKRKYDAYCAWERERGAEPKPFDAQWWPGWYEYTAAHPDWNSPEWAAADDAARHTWQAENGFAIEPETPA